MYNPTQKASHNRYSSTWGLSTGFYGMCVQVWVQIGPKYVKVAQAYNTRALTLSLTDTQILLTVVHTFSVIFIRGNNLLVKWSFTSGETPYRKWVIEGKLLLWSSVQLWAVKEGEFGRWSVQAPKWSWPRNDPQPQNDPQTGPEIIPALKWSPNWTWNDPSPEMIPNWTWNDPSPEMIPAPKWSPALKWSPTGPEMIPR